MQYEASIKDALEQHFNWQTFSSDLLQDRKAFDSACQQYDEWAAVDTETKQLGRSISHEPIFLNAKESTINSVPCQLSSCQRLSREVQVFVAWKASA